MAVRTGVCIRCGSTFTAARVDAMFCPPCKVERKKEQSAASERRKLGSCPSCGASIARRSGKCRDCDNKARVGLRTGEDNGNWKGGKTFHDGYVQVRTGHGKAHHYRFEHHVVWESANGALPGGWVVHHLNGIKTDNRLVNLAAMPRQEHHKHPREALRPYEHRIAELEERVRLLGGDPGDSIPHSHAPALT